MSRQIARLALSLILVLPLLTVASGSSAAAPPVHTGPAPNLRPEGEPAGAGIQAITGHAAFAVELWSSDPNSTSEYLRYLPDTGAPGEWIVVEGTSGTAYYGGDFVGGDYSRLYVIDYNTNQLHTLDTDTGADVTIGSCTPRPGQVWTGATGTAGGTLYASSTDDTTSYLYTINTSTGAATEIGQITNAPAIIDIAIDGAGQMIGLDLAGDNLVRINPATGAGTVIGGIGFDADFAQGMDFEPVSGVLYLAACRRTGSSSAVGELRTANPATGSTTVVGAFPYNAEVGAFAMTPPTLPLLQNPGFESGFSSWSTDGSPILSGASHEGSYAALMTGQTSSVWQPVYIPSDALEVTLGFWVNGASSDPDWDNDLLCATIWEPGWGTRYVRECFGLSYFYYYSNQWKHRIYRLDKDELAAMSGRWVMAMFQLSQDWNPGYHKTSTAYLDDTWLRVTRPLYAHQIHLPVVSN